MPISDSDYYTLDSFVLAATRRVRDGLSSAGEAHSAIMRALAAWDKGNWLEFGPWMEGQMERWKAEGADRNTYYDRKFNPTGDS